MGCYVGGERFLERTFCASLGGALCVHRQPDNIGAERARVFALHYHRKNRRHHFTPASFKMRFPSAPASWPWVVTQTSLPVCGFTNRGCAPLPERFSTKPAVFSLRITSLHFIHLTA